MAPMVGARRTVLRAVGQYRRARALSVWAASGLGFVLAGGAVARLALPPGDVSALSLLAYEVMLCGIAGGLIGGLLSTFWQRAAVTRPGGRARRGPLRNASG